MTGHYSEAKNSTSDTVRHVLDQTCMHTDLLQEEHAELPEICK
jgi:hypothetical protein